MNDFNLAPQDFEKKPEDSARLSFVRMCDVVPEAVLWLWRPYIPIGKLTMLQGAEGGGKSWLLAALAAAVSRGHSLPGDSPRRLDSVLLMSAEDGLADTIRPRLEKAGADTTRVFALDEPLTLNDAGLQRLENAITDHHPLLVGIDPLFAYTGLRLDINRANACRSLSKTLSAIAERHRCAIVMIRHLNKYRGHGDPARAGIGSVDWRAAVRSELLVGADPAEPARRVVTHSKSNLTTLGCSWSYEIRGDGFTWLGESSVTPNDVLSAQLSTSEDRSSLSEAEDFLRQMLSDGPQEARRLIKEATETGINEKTLRRAQKRLGIRAFRIGNPETGQKWVWEFPEMDNDRETDIIESLSISDKSDGQRV